MGYPAQKICYCGRSKIIGMPSKTKAEISKTKVSKKKISKGKNTVYAFRSTADAKNIGDWFIEHKKYIHKFLFDMELGLGRRIGDIMDSEWSAFFYEDGRFKEYWTPPVRVNADGDTVQGEKKTGKYKEIPITEFVRNSINDYFNAIEMDLDSHYTDKVCMQYTGNFKGKEMSYRAFLKQLQVAAQSCNIDYKIATHSMRKTFGKGIIETNPDDPLAKTIVQGLLNHSNEKTTEVYIGLEKEREDNAVNRLNDMYMAALVRGENYHASGKQYIMSLKTSDLREIIQMVYMEGVKAQQCDTLEEHMGRINIFMEMLEDVRVGVRG